MQAISQCSKESAGSYVPESKEKIITVRIAEELHKTVRVRIAQLGTTFQQVMLDLLRQWMANPGSSKRKPASLLQGSTITEKDAALVAQFLDFWHNPHDEVDMKLRKLLEDVLDVREKHSHVSRKSTA